MQPFAHILLTWFAENGRELPWRQTKDPYAIWLSEVIMQQTRITQGWTYWERFMQHFPTVDDLAAATEDEVLRLWQGLGYYSRARNLHAAAKQVVQQGHFPNTLEGIRQLKGVGDYTAAAIASIAFDIPAAVVDGNVYRVLARYFGIDTPINSTVGKKQFAILAQQLLPEKNASTYNQAIMDFGAIQCTPVSPKCLICPFLGSCEALRQGKVGLLPVKIKSLKVKTINLSYVYIRYQKETAIRRRHAGELWQGLWDLPLMADMPEQIRGKATLWRKGIKHVLTHRIILADFYLLTATERPSLPDDFIWIREDQLDDYGKSRLIERLLDSLD